ncbi:bifunctional 3-oxoadipate enol-lactonase/4-carboxymuconolactone decarboxylase PcaDC [Rhodococcus aerolatus]
MSTVPAHDVTDPASAGADAPVVVLLGSLGSTRAMWDPQVGPLSRRHRVVRVDLPGHGGTALPDHELTAADLGAAVLAVLDHLGVARAHVVGLSLGGVTGQWLAVHEPTRVASLALLCTSAHFGGATSWTDRAAAVRAGGTASIAEAVVERWFTPGLAARDPRLVADARAMVAATPDDGYAACCEVLAAWDARPDLGRIAVPTLVIGGSEDPATPPEHQRVIADGVVGARLEVVEGAAHLANLEAAGAVTALLLEHLAAATGASQHDELHRAGMAVRRAVLGDAHVDRAVAATTELTAGFQDVITTGAWGSVWTRPGLDRRSRSVVTLAALTALGMEHELAMHVRAAIRNGLTPLEVSEVLLHTSVYAGVPRGNRALALAVEALAVEDLGGDGAAT